jgi:hypothetical protein
MRSRYVYRPGHPKANERGFVNVEDLGDYGEESRALDAPILAGRFYENTHGTDPEKTDIGSRRKYHDWLKRKDLVPLSETKNMRAEAAKVRAAAHTEDGGYDRKQRRDDIGRAFYEVLDKGKRR